MVFSGMLKFQLNSLFSDISFFGFLGLVGLIYYGLVIHINTRQARDKKSKFPWKVLLIHFSGVGIRLLAPMGVDAFSSILAVVGIMLVSVYLSLDFILARREAKKQAGMAGVNLDEWLK